MLPLCSKNLLGGVYDSRFANKTIRVDLFNRGSKENSIKIITGNKYTKASWDKTDNGVIIEDEIRSGWKEYEICAKAIKSGEMQIFLRGPYNKLESGVCPIIVDYRNLKINGKPVFNEERPTWHNDPFLYKFAVQDNEIIHISFMARRHHFQIGDIVKYYHTNPWILFTILVLSFLIAYKVVQYVSGNKMKHRSQLDTIFVCVFFVLLFVPMSKVETNNKSTQENRMLAPKPELFNNTRGGYNPMFGTDVEKWFNDRFYGRSSALKIDAMAQYAINRVYKKGGAIYFSNNRWMFNLVGLRAPNPSETIECVNQLINLDQFCKQNNINFYVLLVPYKGSIYHEMFEGNYAYNINDDHKFAQYVDKLRKDTGIPIIYPYEELRKARHDDFVFFKQAHHWTDWGAYHGYLALMKVISQDFPNIKTVSLNEYKKFTSKLIRDDYSRNFNIGHTTRLLGIDSRFAKKCLLRDDYVYYNHIYGDNLKINITHYTKSYTYDTGGGKYNIFLTGNSQNEDLLQFLPYSAHKLKYIRLNMGQLPSQEQLKFLKYYKKEVLDFKPNILIYCVSAEVSKNCFLDLTKN